MKIMLILLMVAFLSACSTPQPRATIPVSQYREAALEMYMLGMCGEVGFVDTGIVQEGFGYLVSKHLGSQYNESVLEVAFREEHAKISPTEEEIANLRHGTGLTDDEMVTRNNFQGLCSQYAQAVTEERQRRQLIAQQNARQQQEAINSMSQQLSDMGQMMLDGGNNAMQLTQPMVPGYQPSFGLPSTGYNHSLINSPGGLRQRHCTPTSSGMQYCFE